MFGQTEQELKNEARKRLSWLMCSVSMRGPILRRDEVPSPKPAPRWQSKELVTLKWLNSTTNVARWNP